MKAMPARNVSVKKAAATRSAPRAFFSSSTYPLLPSPGSLRGRSSWVPTGGGVPITRFGTRPSSSRGASLFSLLSVIPRLLTGFPGSEPHRCDDHQADPEEPAREALGHRADAAEAAAAGVGLGAGLRDVRDDRALLRRRDGRVVEDRHRLRAGQHGLVDLRGRGLVERRGVLAARERAAGPGEVVALRAVGAEQLAAERGVAVGRVDLVARRN